MSEPRVHFLKAWPEGFQAILDDLKFHEVRKDDRAYMVGDYLCLLEWEPHSRAQSAQGVGSWDLADGWMPAANGATGRYTDRRQWVVVTYKSAGGTWGLPSDLCVLSIAKCAPPIPTS